MCGFGRGFIGFAALEPPPVLKNSANVQRGLSSLRERRKHPSWACIVGDQSGDDIAFVVLQENREEPGPREDVEPRHPEVLGAHPQALRVLRKYLHQTDRPCPGEGGRVEGALPMNDGLH